MAVQSGKDLLVKLDMTGTLQIETIAGLRASRISFNAETVDVTSLESAGGWRELLAGAGVGGLRKGQTTLTAIQAKSVLPEMLWPVVTVAVAVALAARVTLSYW